jgi:hypothetical protein
MTDEEREAIKQEALAAPLARNGLPRMLSQKVFTEEQEDSVWELRRLLYAKMIRHGANPKMMLAVLSRMTMELFALCGADPELTMKLLRMEAVICLMHGKVREDLYRIIKAGMEIS